MTHKNFFAALSLAIGICSQAHAGFTTVYASYMGAQQGVTERTDALVQTNFFNTGTNINGIGIGPGSSLLLAGGNQLIHYSTSGALINTMTFPDAAINYTDVDYANGVVAATYQGSQQGVTLRDTMLNQFLAFGTGVNASGIALGDASNLYISAGNELREYSLLGVLLQQMVFPDPAINYTDIDYLASVLVASYGGSQQGFTIRDLGLNQLSFVATGFTATGIALGGDSDVFLSSGNSLYRYGLNGTLLAQMDFPDQNILYTGVAVSRVPEPGSLLLVGVAMFGLVAARRQRAA